MHIPKTPADSTYKGISADSRYELWHRKIRRHAKKRLLAFVVIWQVRQCVVHLHSLSKRCERRTGSFWLRPLLSLTPLFAQFQEKEHGLRLMSWRMCVALPPSTN